jgi:hypothetical protein
MVHFLRNSENRTIIECEVYDNDLHSATNIENYSKMLLYLGKFKFLSQNLFITDISNLDEIRGWWFESQIQDEYESIDKFIEEKFMKVADKWSLSM